ncbi:MAG TPA: (Fe-S)-binding protein [Syntrophomonadaceae bacterium]|nr:(Fe-S)-binding protein [Syntrophomonadaceae bacterium]
MRDNEEKNPINELIEQCSDCGACSDICSLLEEIGESPATIAARGATVEEAFSCSLCELCESVCPLDLSPVQMFQAKRNEAVANDEIDIDDYRYLFPDRPMNVMSLFRQVYGVDYQDLNQTKVTKTAFFPGCTMMTYSPDLTRKVFATLSKSYSDIVFLEDCCGKPLYQIGVTKRGDKNREHLRDKIKSLGIKRLVVACPNCYYELRKVFSEFDIELLTVYEVFKEQGHKTTSNNMRKCTVHDSCPDRFDGIFGQQVRQALREANFPILEMEHSQETTICCGSGGQLSHFRPDFAEELVELRLEEAKKTGAEILIAYCHSCVLNFARDPSGIKVMHVLNLLLDFEEDYDGVKNKAGEMFEGPAGVENWEKIMKKSEEE